MGFGYNVRKAIWGEPAATKTERKLIVKIDAFILSYVCLMVRPLLLRPSAVPNLITAETCRSR